MRRAMLKSFAFIAMGGWLAAGPIDLSRGQNSGGATSSAAGTTGAAATGAAASGAAQAQTPAARSQLGAQTTGGNAGVTPNAAARAQAARAAATHQQLRPGGQNINARSSANSQNRPSDARAGATTRRTRGSQASSVDSDRMNDPFDSRFNDRIDNRADNRFDDDRFNDDRFDAQFDRRRADRRDVLRDPRQTNQGLDRAGQQIEANRRRFEDRTDRVNRGLDTARDRVDNNFGRFDERRRRIIDDRWDDSDRRPIIRTDDTNGRVNEGAAYSEERRQRPIERRARFDAGAMEDELGTGMPDDPRVRNRVDPRRVDIFEPAFSDPIERRARFDAGAMEDELGTGMPTDPRVLNRMDRWRDSTDDPRFVDRDRFGNFIADPALTTSADQRLERPRRTFVDADVRTRMDNAVNNRRSDDRLTPQQDPRYRDTLDVRRNLSTRQSGYRGLDPAPGGTDFDHVGADDRTSEGRRMLSDWLDRTARGIDRLNDQLNGGTRTTPIE